MRDKSLGIMMAVLFGMAGLAVLLLGWLWPALEPERLTATLAGGAGLAMSFGCSLILRPKTREAPVRVAAEEQA